jgi:hypothetical protein
MAGKSQSPGRGSGPFDTNASSNGRDEDMTPLRNPAYYIGRIEDGFPLQAQLPEGITLPVFSTADAALRWKAAYDLLNFPYKT